MKSERSEVVDFLKACACVMIVWHHLALYGPMSDVVALQVPVLIRFLFDHGPLAVQVFLVLGGYLSAKSWSRALADADFRFLHRLSSRYQRLAIPLLAALSFTVFATAVVRPFFDHPSLSAAPEPLQVVAHILLLQDILQLEAFSAGVWYVAIDFQLFALGLGAAVVARRWQRWSGQGRVAQKAVVLWVGLAMASLFVWNLQASLDMWAVYFFGAYGLGLCVGIWRQAGFPLSHLHLAVLIALVNCAAWLEQPRMRLLVAMLTAVLLALYEFREGRSIEILKNKWVRQLSDASYAIFLIHFGVSLLFSAVVTNLWPTHVVANALGMLASFVTSIAAGRCLHAQVEKQPPNWRRLLQWAAAFGASCTAVIWLT